MGPGHETSLTAARTPASPRTRAFGNLIDLHIADMKVLDRLEGPPVRLSPEAALASYMAIYELGGTAVKYGAPSNNGSVEVRWTVDRDNLRLVWSEVGGPAVKPPSRKGLGTDLLEQGLAGELDAEVQLDYQPEGLVCTIDAPLQRLVAR